MAKRNIVVVASIAVVFGILAVVLCFAAYANRIKVRDVSISSDGSCNYQSSPAFALGIVAAIFLLIEQIIVSVGTGCFCCRGAGTACPSTCGSISSFILFILSWVTFVIAFLGLIATALLNNSSYLATNYTGRMSLSNNTNTVNDCYLTKDSLFIGDAIWCIITVILGINSFVISKVSSNRNNENQHQSRGYAHFATDRGFAVGQPSTEMQSKGQHLGI